METGQEGSNGQIRKRELVAKVEGTRTKVVALLAVSAQQQLVELAKLLNELLAALGSFSSVKCETGFVEDGLNTGTPMVNQVASLGTLERVSGEEAKRYSEDRKEGEVSIQFSLLGCLKKILC